MSRLEHVTGCHSTLVLAVALLGCGSEEATCVVGETMRCACLDGREGVTECDPFGQPSSACSCDDLGPDEGPWSRALGDQRDQSTVALAAEGDGVVLVGGFEGTLEAGGVPLISAGSRDVFVASLGPGGAHRWSRRYGGDGDDFALGVAVDDAGAIFVVGGFSGELRIPAIEPILLTAEAQTDAFVMRIDPDGEVRWARSWGGGGFDAFRRVGFVPGSGDLYLGGYHQQTLVYEGSTLTAAGGTDAMIARVTKDGDSVFFAGFGGGGDDWLGGVATDGSRYYAAGGYQGFDMALPDSHEGNAVLVLVDDGGVNQGSEYFTGPGRDDARGLAFVGEQLWVAGKFEEKLEHASPPATYSATGGQDIFLVPYTGGRYGEVRTFGDAGREEVTSLVSDGEALLLAGGFDGSLDLGLGVMRAVGTGDGFAALFDGTTGTPREQIQLSSTGFAQVESAVFDSVAGRWWIAGRFDGTLTIGEDTLDGAGASDLFVAAVRAR